MAAATPAEFDPETLSELREGWVITCKGKAQIGVKELCALMHWLGLNPTPQELQEIISAFGSGGVLSQEQFVKSMGSKLAADTKNPDEVTQAFSVFDKDGRGFVSASDLRHVLTGMGDRLDEEQVDAMLITAMGPGHGDGQLNYQAFVKSVLKQ